METELNLQKEHNLLSKPTKKRKFVGVAVSDAKNKTIIVQLERVKIHPKYHKRFTVNKKYKVHDPQNKYHRGDQVIFVECRPLSKEKRWRVIYEEHGAQSS